MLEPDFLIWKDKETYRAVNGASGAEDYSSESAASVIQYALDAASSAGGGTVSLRSAIYDGLDKTIQIRAKTQLKGSGRGTLLRRADSAKCVMFDFEETNQWSTNLNFGQGISNLVIDGNTSGKATGDAIHMGEIATDYDHAPDFGFIENVLIWNVDGWAIKLYDNYWNRLERVFTNNCTVGGLEITKSQQISVIDCRFVGADSGGTAQGIGISNDGYANNFIRCDMSSNAVGYYNAGHYPVTFINCWWEANTVDYDYHPNGAVGGIATFVDCEITNAKMTPGASVQHVGGRFFKPMSYTTAGRPATALSNEGSMVWVTDAPVGQNLQVVSGGEWKYVPLGQMSKGG